MNTTATDSRLWPIPAERIEACTPAADLRREGTGFTLWHKLMQRVAIKRMS